MVRHYYRLYRSTDVGIGEVMENFTLVFTEGGTVAHLLSPGRSPNTHMEALCGRTPWPSLWHGTGTQDEEERALDLALCVRCQSVLNHRSMGIASRSRK